MRKRDTTRRSLGAARPLVILAALLALLGGGLLSAGPVAAAQGGTVAATHEAARKSKPLKATRPMTLKERRAQVATLRTPKKAGVMETLPGGRTLVHKGRAKSSTKNGPSSTVKDMAGPNAAAATAIAAPTNLRIAPHDWFGFAVEWGDVKWDNPVGSQSYHTALYRASDNKLIKQWCDSYTADQTQWAATFTRGIDDPTILTLGVGYYLKVSVSADPGTYADPEGTGCATGWSAEAKSPTIVAQGPPVNVSESETYGCGCLDTTGRMPFQGYLGDPVNTATGAQTESAVDAAVQAPGVSFSMRRTYSSNNSAPGMLGTGWSSAYDTHLLVSSAKVVYVADSGAHVTFTKDASSGAYTASSLGVTATLAGSDTSGFTLTTSGHEKLAFDAGGKLTGWQDAAGVGLSLSYSGADLATVKDAAGHEIKLTVDPTSHLLQKVDLPGGQSVSYGYSNGLLTSVEGTDGGTFTYGYGDNGLLASITDPAGQKVMQTQYDDNGLVTQQTDAGGKTTTFSRAPLETDYKDANGGLWSDLYSGSVLRNRIDPLGNVTSYQYDAKLRLTDVTDPLGVDTTMTYNSAGDMLSRARGGVSESWTYDTAHHVMSYTDGRGSKTSYTYDADQRLKTADGPAGKTSFTYNAAGQVATETSAGGRTTTFGYDAQGHLASRTSPSGAKSSYTYDDAGRVLTSIDPRGNVTGADPATYTTAYAYNSAGQLAKVTDPAGHATSYAYDANGNQSKITDTAGRSTSYGYDSFNRLTSVTGPDGSTTTTGYDANGNVVSQVDEAGDKKTLKYDAANNLISTTSARGNVSGADPAKYTTTYGYDADGNLTQTVDPTGAKTTTAYDAFNRPAQVTDPLGHVTKTGYDADGNVRSTTDALQKTTSYTYDSAGNELTQTDPLGNVTTYTYDADGNRTSELTPAGRKWTWGYDDDGSQTSQTDPRGNATGATASDYTTTYGYDPAGNQTSVTDPYGNKQTTGYDALDQVTTRQDAGNRHTTYTYDELGRIKTVTAPDGGTTSYGYDTAGNVHTRTDANQHTTTYGYDPAHRLTSVNDPLNRTVSYGYDADGNRNKITNGRGIVTTTTFDALGQPTATSYSDGTPATSTVYDMVGNRHQVTDAGGTRTFGYDADNQLTSVTLASGTAFAYTYDAAGELTGRTYPDGLHTTYTYTADGDRSSATTNGQKTTVTHTSAHLPLVTTYPNGSTETRSYDHDFRLTDLVSKNPTRTLASWHAALDGDGRPTRVDGTEDPKGTSTTTSHYYGYDSYGRLHSDCVSATQAGSCPSGSPTTSFTYDAVGNRQSQTTPTSTTTYSYDAADELTKAVTGTSTTNYTYDADGNQTTDSYGQTLAYDATNHLTSSGSQTFAYDADGNRVKETHAGHTWTFAWDINNPLPLLATESSDTGSGPSDHTYNELGQIEYTTQPQGQFYYHHDLNGSITDLTDTSGQDVDHHDYTAFGETTALGWDTSEPLPGTPQNAFGYTGEFTDQKVATNRDGDTTVKATSINLRARSYDPTTGRLTSRDPLIPAQDTPYQSAYAYADNDPTYRTDPSGMCSITTQLKDVFTGNFGWNNNCAKEDRDTATKPPAVQAAKNFSDTATRGLINTTGQASLGLLDGLTFGSFSYLSGAQITCPTAYNVGLYATMVPFPVDGGGKRAVEEGGLYLLPKAVNLPSWKTVTVDMVHVLERHTADGKIYKQSGIKTKFPDYMSPKKIESTIVTAYRYAQTAGPSQGSRVFLRGMAEGLEIEMWLDKQTKIIETAYPVWR